MFLNVFAAFLRGGCLFFNYEFFVEFVSYFVLVSCFLHLVIFFIRA